jgi:hypothetical protein
MNTIRSDSGGGVQLPLGSSVIRGNSRSLLNSSAGPMSASSNSAFGSDDSSNNMRNGGPKKRPDTRVVSSDPLLRTDYETFLFDSFSLQVSLSVILQQLLLHLTFPLCLPYFIHRYGWLFLYTQNVIHKFALGSVSKFR